MKTRTLMRRTARLQEVADRQALERRRLEEQAAQAADVRGAERRRFEAFMAAYHPSGEDPLAKFLQAISAPPSSYAKYDPHPEDNGEALTAAFERIKAKLEKPIQATAEVFPDEQRRLN
jgi:hypothetical protein